MTPPGYLPTLEEIAARMPGDVRRRLCRLLIELARKGADDPERNDDPDAPWLAQVFTASAILLADARDAEDAMLAMLDEAIDNVPTVGIQRAQGLRDRLLTRADLANLPEPEPLIGDTIDRNTLALLAGPWSSAGTASVPAELSDREKYPRTSDACGHCRVRTHRVPGTTGASDHLVGAAKMVGSHFATVVKLVQNALISNDRSPP